MFSKLPVEMICICSNEVHSCALSKIENERQNPAQNRSRDTEQEEDGPFRALYFRRCLIPETHWTTESDIRENNNDQNRYEHQHSLDHGSQSSHEMKMFGFSNKADRIKNKAPADGK